MIFARFVLILSGCFALLCSVRANANGTNADEVCPVAVDLQDKHSHLRSMSLAVRGQLPSMDEYEALAELEDVPEEWIDGWLTSEAYARESERFFDSLLWPNISNLRLFNNNSLFRGNPLWRTGTFPRNYRGSYVTCKDEAAEIIDGVIQTETIDGDQIEGYRMVSPYWAPETQVKVCAFDAQEEMVSPSGNRCDTEQGNGDAGCGCGPNLRWCAPNSVNRDILESMTVDLQMRVNAIIANDESLTEMFESRRAYVNGPLVHYYRHLSEVSARIPISPLPVDVTSLPDLDYTQKDTWVEIELPAYHAGILTSPLFLLRFQTDRSRANRFYNAFMCQPFQPPPGGIPNVDNSTGIDPDLQERAGCKYCHALLEPAAAYWGRWVEGGGGYLNHADFPMVRDDCLRCAQTGQGCSQECRRNYVVNTSHDDEEPYIGNLNAFMFRAEAHYSNIAEGPRLLALRTIVDNRFPRCMAARVTQKLLGREITVEESALIDEMAQEFVQSNYKLRTLTKKVLQSETYRRLR